MINYTITLSLLICAVILLRAVFRKKVPQRLIYALWLAVLIKMCLPFSFIALDIPALSAVYPNSLGSVISETSTVFSTEVPQGSAPITSPMTDPITRPPVSVQQTSPVTDKITAPVTQPPHITEKPTVTAPPITAAPAVTEEIKKPISASPSETVITQSPPTAAEPKQHVFDLGKTLLVVSLLGSVAVGAFFLLSAMQLSAKLHSDRVFLKKEGRVSVYISQNAITPCVFGIIPKIYVTPAAAESENLDLVLRHELTHIRHGDNLWAIVRTAALIIFWYNPFVWAATMLSRRDSELACDEALAAHLDSKGRSTYAHTIIDSIPQKHGHAPGLSGAPIKERLIMLTQKSKTSVICIILALALTLGAAGCSFIGSKEQTPDVPDDGKVSDDTTEPDDTATAPEKEPYFGTIIPNPIEFSFGEGVVEVSAFEHSGRRKTVELDSEHILTSSYSLDGDTHTHRNITVYIINTKTGKIVHTEKLKDGAVPASAVKTIENGAIVNSFGNINNEYTSWEIKREGDNFTITEVPYNEDYYIEPGVPDVLTSPDGKTTVRNIGPKDYVTVKTESGEEKTVLETHLTEENMDVSVKGYVAVDFIDNDRFVYKMLGWEHLSGYGIYNVKTGEKVEYENGFSPSAVYDGKVYSTLINGYEFADKIAILGEDGAHREITVPEKYESIFENMNDNNNLERFPIFHEGKWFVFNAPNDRVYVFSDDLSTMLAEIKLPQDRKFYDAYFSGNRITFFFDERIGAILTPDDTPAAPPELSEELKLEIQKAYVESHNKNNPDKPITQEDVWVFGYRGEYSGAHVVTIHVSGYFYPALADYITVNGEKIWYGSTPPDVYKDGEVYGIEYAFEKGILSAEDIHKLARDEDDDETIENTEPDKAPYVTPIVPRPIEFTFGENVVQVNTFETPACSNYPDYANSFVVNSIYGTTDYQLLWTYRVDYPEKYVDVFSKSSVYLFNSGLGRIEASAKLPDTFRIRHSVMQDDGSVIISGYDELAAEDVSFVLSRDSTLESIDYVHIEDPRDAAIFEKTFVSPDGKTKVQNIYKESVKIIYPSGEEKTVLPRVDTRPDGMYSTVSFACGFIDNERFVYDQLNGYFGIYNVNTHENVVYENSEGQAFVAFGEDGIYTWGYSESGFHGTVGLLDRDGVFHKYEIPEVYSGIFGRGAISFCNGKWAVMTDNELYVFSYDLKTILAQADLPQNRTLHDMIINGDRISLFFSEEKEIEDENYESRIMRNDGGYSVSSQPYTELLGSATGDVPIINFIRDKNNMLIRIYEEQSGNPSYECSLMEITEDNLYNLPTGISYTDDGFILYNYYSKNRESGDICDIAFRFTKGERGWSHEPIEFNTSGEVYVCTEIARSPDGKYVAYREDHIRIGDSRILLSYNGGEKEIISALLPVKKTDSSTIMEEFYSIVGFIDNENLVYNIEKGILYYGYGIYNTVTGEKTETRGPDLRAVSVCDGKMFLYDSNTTGGFYIATLSSSPKKLAPMITEHIELKGEYFPNVNFVDGRWILYSKSNSPDGFHTYVYNEDMTELLLLYNRPNSGFLLVSEDKVTVLEKQ